MVQAYPQVMFLDIIPEEAGDLCTIHYLLPSYPLCHLITCPVAQEP